MARLTNAEERVKVYVRVKPPLDEAMLPPCVSVVPPGVAEGTGRSAASNRLLLQRTSRHGEGVAAKAYAFDGVLDRDASQADVYREVAQPVVDDVLRGYNGTILAYGQTGAGKTHTLSSIKPESIGIIPRAAQDIFQKTLSPDDEVRLSYLQIYCEQIQDLLKPETGDNLSIREWKEGRRGHVGVPELSEMVVTCLDDCLRLIQMGDRNRSVAFTALNAHSSRSHAVVMFTVTRTQVDGSDSTAGTSRKTTGRLFLVDLAGSERLKKSKSVAQRAVEARAINLSLTTLGKCVSARATGQQHVPFRDSKLTRLLQESLGGNAKTSMVVAVRGDGDHAEETYQSLEFGCRAMNVQTHAEVNVDHVRSADCRLSGPMTAADAFMSSTLGAQAFHDLKKDQERSQRVIEGLEQEKLQMIREARDLRDAHEEQLLAERTEKDVYRNRALQAESKALETEFTATKKISELRQQLDRHLALQHAVAPGGAVREVGVGTPVPRDDIDQRAPALGVGDEPPSLGTGDGIDGDEPLGGVAVAEQADRELAVGITEHAPIGDGRCHELVTLRLVEQARVGAGGERRRPDVVGEHRG